jgi:ribosomal protein L22
MAEKIETKPVEKMETKVEPKKVEAKAEVKVENKVEEKKVGKQFATAKINQARISFKQSMILTRQIRGKRLSTAKKWLEDLVAEKINVEGRGRAKTGKKFPTTAEKFLEGIQSLEANAKVKNMNVEKLFLVKAHANAGQTFYRPKSRLKLRGRKAKSTNLILVAAER